LQRNPELGEVAELGIHLDLATTSHPRGRCVEQGACRLLGPRSRSRVTKSPKLMPVSGSNVLGLGFQPEETVP
jgi:hypothetical protein